MYVQIAARPSIGSGVSHSAEHHPTAGIDSGGNGDLHFLLLALQAGAVTRLAGILDDLPVSTACGTRRGDRKETAASAHLTGAVTGGAGFHPFRTFTPRTATDIACHLVGVGDFNLCSEDRIFKIDFNIIAEGRTRLGTSMGSRGSAAPSEEGGEDVLKPAAEAGTEDIAEV